MRFRDRRAERGRGALSRVAEHLALVLPGSQQIEP